jgi:hypothetical protein
MPLFTAKWGLAQPFLLNRYQRVPGPCLSVLWRAHICGIGSSFGRPISRVLGEKWGFSAGANGYLQNSPIIHLDAGCDVPRVRHDPRSNHLPLPNISTALM